MRIGIFLQCKILLLCLLCVMLFNNSASSAEKVKTYVVIGAFKFEENAREWVEFASRHDLDAEFEMNYNRGLYYVYVLSTDNWQNAVDKLHEVWGLNDFKDSWIYTGDFGSQYPEEEPVIAEEKEGVRELEEPRRQEEQINEPEAIKIDRQAEITPLSKEELREEVILKEEARLAEPDDEDLTLGDYTIFFNLFNAANNQDVSGEVQIIDTERAKLIQSVKGGEYTSVVDPNNGSGKLTLIVETFGYRKLQHQINYNEPFADTASVDIDLIGDIMVYHFPLVRYHKGDIATMYNVYFFKDAAIMRPESKYELHRLIEMMEENPGFEIKIHGHINGKSPGVIVTAGEDGNMFALSEDDNTGFGSAKKLSKERAIVIKNYLISNGIDPARMEIKAWGGKRMLYDKHSPQAHKNVRVEIEILEE
ncbi:MAG: OmpA family protein [Candidatus Cyclobacteriaceae bacterium M2_1C_046]